MKWACWSTLRTLSDQTGMLGGFSVCVCVCGTGMLNHLEGASSFPTGVLRVLLYARVCMRDVGI
jgi:hypothetical protein